MRFVVQFLQFGKITRTRENLTQMFANFARQEREIDASGLQGRRRHAGIFGTVWILRNGDPAHLTNGTHPVAAIAARARQDNGGTVLAVFLRHGFKQTVGQRFGTSTLAIRFPQSQLAPFGDHHILTGHHHIDGIHLRPDVLFGGQFLHRQPGFARDQCAQHAFMCRGHVLGNDIRGRILLPQLLHQL